MNASDSVGEIETVLADPDMAGLFVGEAQEHLADIEGRVLAGGDGPLDRTIVEAIYRPFHTIKGNANAVGARTIAGIAHQIESLLDAIRDGQRPPQTADVDVILQATDRLKAMVETIARAIEGGTSPRDPVPSEQPRERAHASATVKVDTQRLDALVDMVGELMILQTMIRESCPTLREPDHVATRQFESAQVVLSQLQRTSLSLRMVSLSRTFQRIARTVHDLSRECRKPVEFVSSGERTELDRHVIEEIADPLLHLIRNAFDHGIEDASTRSERGKPARARLSVSAFHRDGQVCIEITDDGRGLDAARIRDTAVARGLIGATDVPAAPDLHALIFEPGFSTAHTITELSGRGVGMDVVRRNVDALGGRIEIRTTPGAGTTFALKVPLTLAIVQGVLVQLGRERFVLPAHALRESLRRVDCEVHAGPHGQPFIALRDATMPLVDLADLLGCERASPDATRTVVFTIDVDGRRAALEADAVFGVQEFVVKPLETIARTPVFSGSAVLGNGSVGLILDPSGLWALLDDSSHAAA